MTELGTCYAMGLDRCVAIARNGPAYNSRRNSLRGPTPAAPDVIGGVAGTAPRPDLDSSYWQMIRLAI
ncbi:hypothetical protein AB5T46_05465 [Luteimonas sp. C3_2_a3]